MSRHKVLQGGLLAASLVVMLLKWGASRQSEMKIAAQPVAPEPELLSLPTELLTETYEAANATVHMLTIPQSYTVSVAVSDQLQTVEDFAEQTGAVAVLNAGFFDPQNDQTTSHITVNGEVVADPADNERLVGNPDLVPYLEQILNRSEFRRYDCAGESRGESRYDITLHTDPVPDNCTLVDAIGAGPQLLPENTAYTEGFTDYADGALIRDAIGSESRNARTAVGLKADGSVMWFMVAQNPGSGTGMTLEELAQFMQRWGVEKALNLDGGSSSSMVFEETAYYGRLDAEGNTVERPVKSVLTVLSGE
ncbi:MAG: phosphodiester glycosidase family protein [Cyanobacteria bacterium P01_F01_bin.4]